MLLVGVQANPPGVAAMPTTPALGVGPAPEGSARAHPTNPTITIAGKISARGMLNPADFMCRPPCRTYADRDGFGSPLQSVCTSTDYPCGTSSMAGAQETS